MQTNFFNRKAPFIEGKETEIKSSLIKIFLTECLLYHFPIEVKLPFACRHIQQGLKEKHRELCISFYDDSSRKCLPGGLIGHMEWEVLSNRLPFPYSTELAPSLHHTANRKFMRKPSWPTCAGVQHMTNAPRVFPSSNL